MTTSTTTTTATATADSANVLNLLSPATAVNSVSGDVPATLTFYVPPLDGSDPYYYVHDPPAGVPQFNIREADHTVTIHDLRGKESSFSLDRQAFLPVPNVPFPADTDFLSSDSITSTYYPATEAILRAALPDIQEIFMFDHTIRQGSPSIESSAPRGPVLRVHIDQTAESGFERARVHLSESRVAEIIAQGLRTRIINVWRPLNGPVQSHPLAMADSSTVLEEDLVSVAHIYPERTGATGGVKFNENQKWWYWSGQTPDDVMLIKCYDSDTTVGGGAEGKRGRTPHSAFKHPGTSAGTPMRHSIEVRCLIVG